MPQFLPPPPTGNDPSGVVFRDWFYKLKDFLADLGTVTSIDISGGTTGLSFTGGPITTSGTITMSGTLDATNGGTGQASYVIGDILYADSASSLARLPIGSDGEVLTIVTGLPDWGPGGGSPSNVGDILAYAARHG